MNKLKKLQKLLNIKVYQETLMVLWNKVKMFIKFLDQFILLELLLMDKTQEFGFKKLKMVKLLSADRQYKIKIIIRKFFQDFNILF